jgi:hypothetical protein
MSDQSEHFTPATNDDAEPVSAELVYVGEEETGELELADWDMPWDDEQLRAVHSIDDAAALVGRDVLVSDVSGHGFKKLERNQKDLLVGVPCMFVHWRPWESKQREGQWFTAAFVITDNGEKYIINDSAKLGIHGQLQAITSLHGITGGLRAPGGLQKDVFDYDDPITGEKVKDGAVAYRIVTE